ncbi:RNA-binding (RRM/RBD/RNP motifs) family protein [Euphorbia peplus]|nr:RNA-binding (RRM/RBD/RNP motifs) family protein [Euphorbia peplus]
MESNKKRKAEETNGTPTAVPNLSPDDIRSLISPFSKENLLEILLPAATRHPDILDSIRTLADADISLRKLFIRGLSSDTTSETLHSLFSSYGDLEEAIVIFDKTTAKSKGYGFITFKHVDGALIALKEPSKKIDGRMTVSHLASAGQFRQGGGKADVSMRKIYVGNVPYNIPSQKLLGFFLTYGEIEEGPLGFDKVTGKSKGFAFFIYKNEEAARAAVADPEKVIDGQKVICKMAADNNNNNNNKGVMTQGGGMVRDHNGPPQPQPPPQQHPSVPGPHYVQPPFGVSPYVGQGNMGNRGYDLYGVSQYMGPASGEMKNMGNSMPRMPLGSAGMSSGGYPEAGPYSLSHQHQQQPMLPPRVPPPGMHQGMPPYY